MSNKYKVRQNDKARFATITTVSWVAVFTRPNHKTTLIDPCVIVRDRMP